MQGEERFSVAFAEMVMAWNDAENRVRALLRTFLMPVQNVRTIAIAEVFTADLSADQIVQILRSLGDTILTGAERKAVQEVVKLMDVLRIHRNFYVHGIQGAVSTDNAGAGFFHGRSGRRKGGAAQSRQVVTTGEMEEMTRHILEFRSFANHVVNYINWKPGHEFMPVRPAAPTAPSLPPELVTKKFLFRQLMHDD